MRLSIRALVPVVAGLSLFAAGCGDDSDVVDAAAGPDAGRPTVVVTTNIIGDVVENLVGDQFDVVTIMPVGADPHDFQPSAEQVAQMGDAEALVINGGDFEEGLLDVISSAAADGVPMFEAIDAVETLDFGEDPHDEHGDDEAEHGEDEDDDEHDHEGVDPHFFTDPARMALAADGIVEFLVESVDGIDAQALQSNAQAYVEELNALDAEVEQTLAGVAADGRILVTNHEVFAYFADRYDFEVVGTVIPSGATTNGASAEGLADLAELIELEGVSAIFADTSSSDQLAQTLAAEVGDVEVVELFSESLGDADSEGPTYLDMVRVNAQRIADALAA